MTTTLPATKARQKFFKLLEEAEQPGAKITITVKGIPKVVMMPAEEFEEWQETLDIMSDQKLLKGIKKGLENIKKGKTYSSKEVKKRLGL